MSTSGVVKNSCLICKEPLGEHEKAFLTGPVKTDINQHGGVIGVNRIGTSKRFLTHEECWIKNTDFFTRIEKALEVAYRCGTIDGGHHKMWVIDQMVRELTGCPLVKATAKGSNGTEYEYETLGESEEYKEWVRYVEDGEDGPKTYEWDEGCPP